MHRKQILHSALIILVGYLLTGCIASSPTKPDNEQVSLDRVQLGDNNLTCSEMSGQVSELDQIVQEHHEDAANNAFMQLPTAAGTQATTRTLTQFAPSSVPYLGTIVSVASSTANQYFAQQQVGDQGSAIKAQIRKDYLVSLYNQKNCLRPNTANTLTRNAQGYLNKLGYSCGVADGVVGPKTREAIRKYQADHGLQVDGNVTVSLVASLKQAATGSQ